MAAASHRGVRGSDPLSSSSSGCRTRRRAARDGSGITDVESSSGCPCIPRCSGATIGSAELLERIGTISRSDVCRGEDMASNGADPEPPCSFEEFKLYYESTEKVTDRRINTNRWNYSISVGIILAIAAVYSWATSNRPYFILAGAGILVLSAAAAVFCLFWLRQVEDWKALNSAKFQVLNDMASRVQFELSGPGLPAKSYEPFDKEWKILQSQNSVAKVRIFRLGQLEALNASGAELFMPRAFMGVFAGSFLIVLTVMILSWGNLPREFAPTNNPSPTPPVSTSPTTSR